MGLPEKGLLSLALTTEGRPLPLPHLSQEAPGSAARPWTWPGASHWGQACTPPQVPHPGFSGALRGVRTISRFEASHFPSLSRDLWELGATNTPALQIDEKTEASGGTCGSLSPPEYGADQGSGSGPYPLQLHCPQWMPLWSPPAPRETPPSPLRGPWIRVGAFSPPPQAVGGD